MFKTRSRFRVLLVSMVAVLVTCCISQASATEYRAFWVDAWGAGALSQAQVNTLLGVVGDPNSRGQIRDANCNMVVVQVRRNCDANYPSSMGEPYMSGLSPAQFNSLQAVIDAAHDTTGGKQRVEVHAWIVTFRTSGGAVYAAHSSPPTGSLTNLDNYWPSRTASGAEASDKAFDPGHPLAEEYTVNVCMDLVNNFDIDGLHYDYIRFTGGDQGYNPTSIARYNARYGLTGQPSSTNDQFDQWRRDQISNLVRKVYAKTQASKPNVKLSGAFVTWNPSPTASTRAAFQTTRPYGNRTDGVFSDWDAWMEEGIVDLAIPMNYYNYASLPADWTRWMNFIKDRKFNRQAIVGPGIYLNSLSNAILEIQQTREPSPAGNYADGFCGYSYRVPYTSGTWANFSPQLVSQVTPTWDDIPPMPWKTNPTQGHISGTVTDGATGWWIDGATVSITGPESRSMLADGTGFYAFIDLIPGIYTVTASEPGYPNGVRTVDVAIGAVTGNMYVTDIPLGSTPPPTISSVQASAIASAGATITWTTDVASTSQVEYGTTTSYGTLNPLDGTLVTSHSVALNGLTPDTTYHYRVKSRDEANNEAVSGDYMFTTPADTAPPTVPTNVTATAASYTRVNVSWTASTDDVGVTGYKVFRDTVQIGASATTSYSDSTCAPNTTYNYTVSAYDAASNESARSSPPASVTTPADTTAPSVPAGLTATAVSATQVDLSWTASTDTIGVTGYKVFRDGVQIGASATAGYSDTTCQPSTGYNYTVSAYDAAGNNSAQSAAASATTPSAPDTEAPTVPTDVTATAASCAQVNVSWAASADNVAVTGYKVFRDTVQIGASATTSYSDSTCEPNTTYNYTVSAYDAASNESARSSPPASVTTPADTTAPSIPPGLTAAAVSATQVDLSWTASTDDVGVTGYKVFRDGAQIGISATTSYSDSTCAPNTTYNYTVSAYDVAGNESEQSSPPASVTTPADTTAPTVPTGLSATAISQAQVNLAWTGSTDNVGVTGYKVFRNGVQIGTSATTNYSDTTCAPSTTYNYTVSAYDAAGNSSAQSSPPASATTLADTSAPTVPTGLSATAVSQTQINLSWTASTDNVAVTGYKVFRDGVQIGMSTTTSYSDSTCAPNTTYNYTVSAYDAALNESAQSSPPASATTPADTSAPTVPTGLSATAVSQTQVNLAWTGSTDNIGVTGYRVFRDGAQIGASATTNYSDTTCAPNTTYNYTVSAYDAAGNISAQSAAAVATTPGGPLTKDYAPTSITLTRGTVTSGTVANLAADDASYLVITAGKVNNTRYTDWYSAVTIAEPRANVTKLTITFNGKLSASLNQRLYLYNFTTSAWVQIDSRTVGTSDATVSWNTTTPLSYISTAGQIRLRQYVTRSSNFTSSSDLAQYKIEYH